MWLKNDKSIHFKAKLFTVHLSAKTEGYCSDLHGQQEKLQVLIIYLANVIKGCAKIRDSIPSQSRGWSLSLPFLIYGSKSNNLF